MRERDASTSSTSWSQEQMRKWEVIAYYWNADDEGGIAAVQRVKHYSSLALFSGLHWIGSGEEQGRPDLIITSMVLQGSATRSTIHFWLGLQKFAWWKVASLLSSSSYAGSVWAPCYLASTWCLSHNKQCQAFLTFIVYMWLNLHLHFLTTPYPSPPQRVLVLPT